MNFYEKICVVQIINCEIQHRLLPTKISVANKIRQQNVKQLLDKMKYTSL